MAYIVNPEPREQPSRLRVFRFPLVVLIACGVVFAVPFVMAAYNLDDEVGVPLFMLTTWLMPILAFVLISVWWLFFSPFRWLTVIGGAVLAAVLVVGALWSSVRKVEMTTTRVGLVPRLHFVWERSPQQKVEEFLALQSVKDVNAPDATVGPEDYAAYRGPRRDGHVPHIKLETDWAKSPPQVVWRHPCSEGYSGLAVAGNLAVTLEQRAGKEYVVCYERGNGKQRWAHAYADAYVDRSNMGDGPRSTPTIHDKRIFAIGPTGHLVCLDPEGKELWSTNVLKDGQSKHPKWGLTGSPLIFEDLVIAHAGVDPQKPAGASLIAYEQASGKKRWAVGNRKAGYSSPMLATLGGVQQVLLFDAAGLVSYEPKTGKELWQRAWTTWEDMNSIQPLVIGDDRVFISSEPQNGCVLLRVRPNSENASGWEVENVWQNSVLGARFANPVSDGKRIFGLHNINGVMKCLDVETGKLRWISDRRFGPGQMLMTDGVLLATSGEDGGVVLVDPEASEYRELAYFRLFDGKTWNTPALAGDQLFVRNQSEIACLKLPRR